MPALRAVFRQIAARPMHSGLIIAMLATGIGVTTAVYSLFQQILLEPLPVARPEQLVNLNSPGLNFGSTWGSESVSGSETLFTHEMFEDLAAAQQVFTGIAAHADFSASFGFEGTAQPGRGALVSGSYFGVLGLAPALGRLLQPQDTALIDQSPVVVLSFDYWQREMRAREDIVGETLIVNGRQLEIIGVAPRGFSGTAIGWHADVFVPYTLRWLMQPAVPRQDPGRSYWLYLFARLAPGVSVRQAEAALTGVYQGLLRDVAAPALSDLPPQRRAEFLSREIVLEPGFRGRSTVPSAAEEPLTLLLGLTAAVVLIVCVNVAGLLLSSGAARAAEFAIRVSIGATRKRLLGQLLLESGALALIGGALSLPVAASSLAVIARFLPAEQTAGLDFALQPIALAFAAGVTVATVLVFGLGPAWVASGAGPGAVLKAAGMPSPGGRRLAGFREVMAGAQIAFSTVLLVLAGLFAQSLWNLGRVELGFETRSLLSFRVAARLSGYAPEEVRDVVQRIHDALSVEPGVTAVGISAVPLLDNGLMGYSISTEGFAFGAGLDTFSTRNIVSPDFFSAIGIQLRSGRVFTAADRRDAPPVAVVNERFVEKFALGDAIGKRFSLPYETQDIEIVGVVGNAKYNRVKLDDAPQFFQAMAQTFDLQEHTFYVSTTLDPADLLSRVPGIVAAVAPGMPLRDLRTMEQQVAQNVYLDRLTGTLAAGFALLATFLAAVGIYALMYYNVVQRTRELGLRFALGAARGTIYSIVLFRVLRIALIGALVGLAAAFAAGRAAESLLFGLSAFELHVYLLAVIVLVLIALSAGALPARRAAAVDPMAALREE